MNLRPYQLKAVDECREAFKKWQRIILCLPTGGGKTVIFSYIARQAIEKGKRVMILCDRKELIRQAHDKVKQYGLNPTIIAPGNKQSTNSCYIASVDTLVRRTVPEIDLLIVDEAHKRKFDKVLTEIYPNVRTIGATATPIRAAKHSLHTMYGEIVEPITITQLIDEKFLVTCRTYGVRRDFSGVKQKFNPEIGEFDYDQQELYYEFNKPALYTGVVQNYIKFAKGSQAIVFNVNVEHSKNMAQEFNRQGIEAYHIDGNTPTALRQKLLFEFENKKFPILCNCGIATTGYDCPSIETVIVNRATMSLALFMQMVGRGSRTYENKYFFNLIDMGGNVYKHGFWEQERKFTLEAKKARQTESFTPVKDCEQCEALVLASARKCNFCGYEFPKKEKVLLEGEFQELDSSIIAKDKNAGKKNTQLWKLNDFELIAYGEEKGYKFGWAKIQIEKRHKNESTPDSK